MKRSGMFPLTLGAGLLVISGLGAVASTQRPPAEMAAAAERFLAALTPEQRGRAVFDLESEERMRWHFIPVESYPRNGLMIKDMSDEQRARAHALLQTGLSQSGYLTATTIMQLEEVLRAIEGGARMARDPEEYLLSVFGTPSADGSWAWRFEGHHLSLHFTVVDGSVIASAPAFLGANPAEVMDGPMRGTRALGPEEDAARALLASLDPEQLATAIIMDAAPRDIVTGAELEIDPLSPEGVAAADLSPEQLELLMSLIDAYTSVMADDIAEYRMERLRAAGIDDITFAWAGDTEPGNPHYYRVQGPSFLIEYDNTQNDANHIHSVWRDFNGDFGRDLLREHVRGTPHN